MEPFRQHARAANKQVLFINNAIHPGEPAVDATNAALFRSS